MIGALVDESAEVLNRAARPVTGTVENYDSLPELSGDRRIVGIGGMIDRPETEIQSHYFEARLAQQFHAAIHIDHSGALEPLERTELWDRGEPAETRPTGP